MKLEQPVFKKLLIIDDGAHHLVPMLKQIKVLNYIQDGWMAESCHKALSLIPELLPQCILLDVNFTRQEINGVQCMIEIHKKYPHIKVIGYSTFDDSHTVAAMMGAGAIGFISKTSHAESILEALQHAAANKYYICNVTRTSLTPELIEKYNLPPNGSLYNLTERQLQVVAMLLNGYETKEISKELCLSNNTVSTHRKNIFKITRVKTVNQLHKLNAIHNFVSRWWGVGKRK